MTDQIDFDISIWHPLDHHWWEFGICYRYYGGTRTHLELVWKYRSGIREWWGRQTRCRFGRHEFSDYWIGPGILINTNAKPVGQMCLFCAYKREFTEE